MQPIKQFCSFSHKDRALAEQLDEHFGVLRRLELVVHWFSYMIPPGDEWEPQVTEKLNSAEIILLLVSSSFIDSDYCYGVELRRALKRHEDHEARVIPVILRPCLWHIAPFGKSQALPDGGNGVKPITTWDNMDAGFGSVVQSVHDVVKTMQAGGGLRQSRGATRRPTLSARSRLRAGRGAENR